MAEAGADVRGKELFEAFEISSSDIDASAVVCGGVTGEGKLRFSVQKDDALSDAGQKLGEQPGGIVQGMDGDGDDPGILFGGVKHFYGTGDISHGNTSDEVCRGDHWSSADFVTDKILRRQAKKPQIILWIIQKS